MIKYNKLILDELENSDIRNIFISPVWILKVEKIYHNGRFYLKTYLFQNVSDIAINEIVFDVSYNQRTHELKVFKFTKAESYLNDTVFGCLIELPEDYKDEEYEIVINSSIINNQFIDYSKTIKGPLRFDIGTYDEKKMQFLRDNLQKFTIFPEVKKDYWRCSCGKHNSHDQIDCLNCGSSKLNVLDFVNKGFEDLFVSKYTEKTVFKANLKLDYDTNINNYFKPLLEMGYTKNDTEKFGIDTFFVRSEIEKTQANHKKKRTKVLKIFSAISILIVAIISSLAIMKPEVLKYVRFEFFESNLQTKYEELYNIEVFNSKSRASYYFKEYIIDMYKNKDFQNVVDTLTTAYRYSNNAKSSYSIKDAEINIAFEESLYELAKNNKDNIEKLKSISKSLNRLNSKYENEVNIFIDNYYIFKITEGSSEVRNYFYEKYKRTNSSADYGYMLKAIHYYISNDGVNYKTSASIENGYSQEYGFDSLESFYSELKKRHPNLAEDQAYDRIKLLGYWSGGGRYFQLKSNGYINYDLPWFDYGDYYDIYNHIIFLFPENNESASRNLFKITFLSDNSIKVYCYEDGSTYTLYK